MGCAPRPRGLPAASSRWGRATIGHEELIVLTDQIYEAALDGGRWPGVLITLVDAIGAAHVSIAPGPERQQLRVDHAAHGSRFRCLL
jgi:hypothetical protein